MKHFDARGDRRVSRYPHGLGHGDLHVKGQLLCSRVPRAGANARQYRPIENSRRRNVLNLLKQKYAAVDEIGGVFSTL